jgi:hypothetical protein
MKRDSNLYIGGKCEVGEFRVNQKMFEAGLIEKAAWRCASRRTPGF